MATDTRDEANAAGTPRTRPSLRIERIQIRNLKSIRSLDLPGDGLGWHGPIPDVLTIGGANGSGKTTLLEFLASALDHTIHDQVVESAGVPPPSLQAESAQIDFTWGQPDQSDRTIRFCIGDADQFTGDEPIVHFVYLHEFVGLTQRRIIRFRGVTPYDDDAQSFLFRRTPGESHPGPGLLYIPTNREISTPATNFKQPGRLDLPRTFVHRWSKATAWDQSLEAYLYALRWADLNAKEEGDPEDSHHFRTFSEVVDRFFGGRKRLAWRRGELRVETKSGATHAIDDLSSGEQQVLLFAGEILRNWSPGSIALIDEPELHLHESYQTMLWDLLTGWRAEHGGQLIFATQSNHFFGLGEPGTKLLLTYRQSW